MFGEEGVRNFERHSSYLTSDEMISLVKTSGKSLSESVLLAKKYIICAILIKVATKPEITI